MEISINDNTHAQCKGDANDVRHFEGVYCFNQSCLRIHHTSKALFIQPIMAPFLSRNLAHVLSYPHMV